MLSNKKRFKLVEWRDVLFQALEEEMHASGLSEEEKEERRKEHYRKESNYLRIKRQRLAYADFETLKIIGKGASLVLLHPRNRSLGNY